MNKSRLTCTVLGFVLLTSIVAADILKPSIADLWGTEDVLDIGLRPYSPKRTTGCKNTKNEGACKECCIKKGCQTYKFKKGFAEISKRGAKAIHNSCICFKVSSNSHL